MLYIFAKLGHMGLQWDLVGINLYKMIIYIYALACHSDSLLHCSTILRTQTWVGSSISKLKWLKPKLFASGLRPYHQKWGPVVGNPLTVRVDLPGWWETTCLRPFLLAGTTRHQLGRGFDVAKTFSWEWIQTRVKLTRMGSLRHPMRISRSTLMSLLHCLWSWRLTSCSCRVSSPFWQLSRAFTPCPKSPGRQI